MILGASHILRMLCALAVLAASPGCAQGGRTERVRTGVTPSSGEAADVSAASLEALFKDDRDFAPEELGNDGPPCPFAASGKIGAWPAEARRFLALHLAPLAQELADKWPGQKLAGYYLLRVATNDAEATRLAVTCLGDDGRVRVLVNAFLVEDRKARYGAKAWTLHAEKTPSPDGLETRFLPDQLLATLVHETFHAVDFAKLLTYRGHGATMTPERRALFEASWDAGGEPLFERIPVLALAGSAAQERADDYRFLATRTNFLAPYAQVNHLEDLAVTLETYWLATRYAAYQKREVTGGLYTFDQQRILGEVAGQRAKACQAAALVFAEECEVN